MRNLVIVGATEFAEHTWSYFTNDSDYNVVAFAVEREYHNADKLVGLPIVCLEDVGSLFPPETCDAFVAVGYNQMNHTRERLCNYMRGEGGGIIWLLLLVAKVLLTIQQKLATTCSYTKILLYNITHILVMDVLYGQIAVWDTEQF